MKVRYEAIDMEYKSLMQSAYEKANIWPEEDAQSGKEIIDEEVWEVNEAVEKMTSFNRYTVQDTEVPTAFDCEKLEGYALSVIFEALQVIASARKYKPIFNNTYTEEA